MGLQSLSPHRSVKKLLAHFFPIREKMPNGFKEFAYRNLERDDRHDQFLNDENLAHSEPKEKHYIRTRGYLLSIALTFVA